MRAEVASVSVGDADVVLAEVVRGEWRQYRNTHFTTPVQRKAMWDIAGCRTEAMRTVTQKCERCEGEYRLYCSCRNRCCPSCGEEGRRKWLEARRQEILAVPYLQVVFVSPAELNVLARYCPAAIYGAVIRAADQTVMDVGYTKLQLQLGCQSQLQTWTQSLAFHLHVHCVVPCGGFTEDGQWVSFGTDDLPRKALRNRFRSLLLENIREAAEQGELDCLPREVSVEQLLQMVKGRKWRVYAEPPFGGAEKLFEYLSRYTHHVAITNDRIESYENHQVTIRQRHYRHRNEQKRCTLGGQQFLGRLLRHVPPKRFVRLRSCGFLANRYRKTNIERARQLIGQEQRIGSMLPMLTSSARLAPSPEVPEQIKPVRLCPKCYAELGNRGPRPPFAPSPKVASQLPFTLRPPPS